MKFLPFGARKEFKPESEEHLAFMFRQSILSMRKVELEMCKRYEGGITPQAVLQNSLRT